MAGLAVALLASVLPVTPAYGDGLPPLIPMRDFFRNPEKVAYELSPNGEYLAFLAPWESRLNVHVQKIGEETVTRVTSAKERDILGYIWKGNGRILYVQDTAGDENYRAYAVGIDGSNLKELTPFEKVQVRFVDELKDDDAHMLISMNKRDPRLFDVYRIDVNTGEMEMIAENPGNIAGWVTDNAGKLRCAVTSDGVQTSLLYRATEADSFRTVLTTSFKETLSPLYFTFDDKMLYVTSNLGRDKRAIYTYDPETAKLGDLIYENPDVDVDNLLRSEKRKVITGVSYVTDKQHYHFLDDQRRAMQEDLEKQLPNRNVVLAGMSRDETKFLVVTYGDKSLGSYYFYDLSSKKLSKLADISPWIDEQQMADMKPVSYKSRDGLTIHGYLTLPRGVEAKNLPVVVNPHGGPWYRDQWGWNPEVQFLANRGYAVLQMNFRGSTGYGKEFWQASFKEWGKKMQDDITDGAQWLIDQGIADPKRIAIYGGSYGGYATLAGMTFTPDLYACGVDYVGVSNLFTFLNSIPPYWELMRQMFFEMIGDPESDKALLEEASPFFHADHIKAPLMVAQGLNDPRVKKAESDQIVDALKARGIDVPYMVKENEGHGFLLEENRFDFYRAMEQFLGRHIGGRVEKV
ncbi:MAG: alpha/beta hydrolase family protein [Candidatus Eisenbacteria bacterium]